MEKTIRYEQAVDSAAAGAESISYRPAGWRDFVNLAKPGILFSNAITIFGGFWVASKWDVDWLLLIYTLLGTVLVMASGCVLNNYLDRDMDTKMSRTKKRALPSGRISPKVVLGYGIALGVIGTLVLEFLVESPLCALLGLLGLFVYVWVYTAWLKRSSVWSTTIGAISGAVPPMIGYCAVSGTIDIAAWLLFAIMFLWQPPHFWALGIRRVEEYRAAGFNILPVVKGAFQTKLSMVRYVVLLVPATVLLYYYGYVGEIYMTAATVMGLFWAYLCVVGFKTKDDTAWSMKVFLFSVNYLMVLFLIMVLDADRYLSKLIGL